MNITSSDEIAGFPAIELRTFFRKCNADLITIDNATYFLDIGKRKAKNLLEQLENKGYIERRSDRIKDNPLWKITPLGAGLRMASAAKPIKRETADRLLKEVLERIETANKSDEYLHRIPRIVVFGSYLNPDKQYLSDLDLALDIQRRESNPSKYCDLVEELAKKDGKEHLCLIDKFGYPKRKLFKFLRNKSKGLSLHTTDDLIITTQIPTKEILFEN